jgi:hypothetical protein
MSLLACVRQNEQRHEGWQRQGGRRARAGWRARTAETATMMEFGLEMYLSTMSRICDSMSLG